MNDKYKLRVNSQWEYELDAKAPEKLDVVSTASDSYHILQQGKPFRARVIESRFEEKKYTIQVNSNVYEVALADGLDNLISEMGFASGSAKSVKNVEAPMPGLILDINVRVGQAVNEDDPLLILEAMKMENVITSPRDGIIKSIAVSQGDAVDKKNLLVEFE